MSDINRLRSLAFDGKFVKAQLIENARDFVATGVVTNLSSQSLHVDGEPIGIIPPWKSAILNSGKILRAERASIVHVPDPMNLGGVVFDGWDWFGNRMAEFPRATPLYISAYDHVGEVTFNPWQFSNNPAPENRSHTYDIRLNLWWAPPKTDAGIHNTHAFIEIHTQIYGFGRIQIFADSQGKQMYREITAGTGDTHDPIVWVKDERNFIYPWHRGLTDTDAIWMAIEFHPKT